MKPYRNPKILAAARGQPCQACGREDGTIVAAHSNSQQHGKGMGIKADDRFVAFLCHDCHDSYDRHTGFTQDQWERAHLKTVRILRQKGIL